MLEEMKERACLQKTDTMIDMLQVRVEFRYKGYLNCDVRVGAHALNDAQVTKPTACHFQRHSTQDELQEATQTRPIRVCMHLLCHKAIVTRGA